MTILWTAWKFLKNSFYARVALIVAIAFGAWQVDRATQRAKGREQVVQASKQEGNRRNAKARKRRDSVPLGAARKRLLDYARDR